MAGAFQSSAFQNSAFQTGVTVSTPSPHPIGGGGGVRGRKRRLGLYWPKLTKTRTEEDVVATVIQEVLDEVVAAPSIDVGALAGALIETVGYAALRRIESQERFLDLIKRELEEMDDEEALIWLL